MRLRILPLVALTALLLGGCGADAELCLEEAGSPADGRWVREIHRDGDVLRIVRADGREDLVPRGPRRIVSTLPGLTESVAYLGAADRLVGVSNHCDRPSEVQSLPRISVMPLDHEALTLLRPDLVLADATLFGIDADALRRRGTTVLSLESRSLEHLETSMRVLAEVLDTGTARERAAAFARAVADAKAAVARPAEAAPVRVLLLAQADPLYVLGPGSLLDDMVRACGAVNVACDLGRASGPFVAELVRERRPDWILLTGEALPDARLAQWAGVPAVAKGRVAFAASDDLVRAGPRTPGALRRLGGVLHGRLPPDRLGDAP